MILTTREAADLLRVTPEGVRKMVERGELRPLVPGARPLRFGLLDVTQVQVQRMSAVEHDTLDTLAARLLAFGESVCHDEG
ncbi:MAG: helix-turn-helix domain-containing protein [Comamonadaceae bacterium]|nr:helix-turn-helix domain-containing protein [Comamonadaceae bacterium]